MSKPRGGLSPDQRQAVHVLAGAGPDAADAAGGDEEAVMGWLLGEPEFIAELNRARSYRAERLRADVRALASDAVAVLRELLSGPEVPPAVRLNAALAVLRAASALNVDSIGPTSARGVQAVLDRAQFLESLG